MYTHIKLNMKCSWKPLFRGGYFFESSTPKKGCIFKVCAPIRDKRKFGGLAYSREGAYSRKYAVLEMNSVGRFNLPIEQLKKPTVQQSK